MRGLAVILTIVFVNCISDGPSRTWGDDVTFPYTAEVATSDLEVRCGPGWDYYPTTRLRPGSKVEVYRHEPGGWLAIRPPKDSVSWLPARQVEREIGSGVGKILIDGAVAWVGSSVIEVSQHKWQVRLKRGELVEILGERSLSIGPGFATETYYMIAPPAGEFRWIHSEKAAVPPSIALQTSTRTIKLSEFAEQQTVSSQQPKPSQSSGNLKTVMRDVAEETEWESSQRDADLTAIQKEIDQLKVELSLLVSKQIDQWDLAALRQQTDSLAKSAKGTSLARQVRLIAYRIGEFELLQERHQRIAEASSFAEEDPRIEQHGVRAAPQVTESDIQRTSWQRDIKNLLAESESTTTSIDRMAGAAGTPDPQFDAIGWLMPVHSTRRAAPPFALLDDDGRVICYVQAAPGLNLRRYAKKHVGLFGNQRFITDLRASLITVSRVVKQKD